MLAKNGKRRENLIGIAALFVAVLNLLRDFFGWRLPWSPIFGWIAAIVGLTVFLALALWRSEPLRHNFLKPIFKFVTISLTLIIPIGAIIWTFVFWIAEDLTLIIKNRGVFLSVVVWLTVSVSAYSLAWGMWLYPAIIRPLFSKPKTQ